MTKKPIAWKEMFAVVLLLCTFRHSLHNQSVTMFVDNNGIVQCIIQAKSMDPARVLSGRYIIILLFIMLIINLYTCTLWIMVQQITVRPVPSSQPPG